MDVPGFEIKKTIGRGGMGIAYLAIQESLGRRVVLKTMNTAQAEQTDFLERFLNEGRIIAALRHPNIVTIYDIGATEELVYMSMEFVEGGDLRNRIESGFTPEQALDVIERVASALDYAHHEGVIHRDVKPANILFREDGTPLLSDFGIAKQTKIDSELTSTGTILGSPFYMSPEQAEGMNVDGRADIYSLGIIFYELLTGERPYPGDSAIKIIVQHIQSPVPTLPRGFEVYQPLLNRMIAKDREQRFAQAGEVVDYLQTLRRQLPGRNEASKRIETIEDIEPPTPTRPVRDGSTLRLVGLLGTVFILIAALAGFYFYTESLTQSAFARPVPATATGPTNAAEVLSANPVGPGEAGESGPDFNEVAEALERAAQARLEQDILTDPPGDNAEYFFSRLLEFDPGHPERANKGLDEIAERYVVLAEEEFSQSNYRQAQTYITLGLRVRPDYKGLLDLQSFIDNRERSVIENIISFFTGSG